MKLYYLLGWAAIVVTTLYSLGECKKVKSWLSPKWHAWLRSSLLAALAMCACLAVGNYTDWGKWRHGSFVNAYEFFHYYMGSKYAPEIGYTNLYATTLVADSETDLKFGMRAKDSKKSIRDLGAKRYVDLSEVLDNKQKYKDLFTEARWQEFVDDVVEFKKRLIQARWNNILRDKGYNATPVWSFVTRSLFSNRISSTSGPGMMFMALLDPLLIAIAMACVWWAFGPRAMMLAIMLLGTHYMMHWWHMKGALLRTDWVVCAIMAVCMLKKEHYKTAGCLLAYSFLARVFPAVLFFGMGAKLFWDVMANRRISRNYINFFAAATVTVVVLVACSLVQPKGPELWREFRTKISQHASDVSYWRVGFKQIYATDFATVTDKEKKDKDGKSIGLLKSLQLQAGKARLRKARYETRKGLWWSIQAAVLVLCLFMVKGLKDHEALSFSFVPLFFLVAPTYYYYIMLLVPLLFFVPQLERPSRAAGIIMMFMTAMAGYAFYNLRYVSPLSARKWGQAFPTYYSLSVLILIMVLYMMVLAAVQTWQIRRKSDQKPVEEQSSDENASEPDETLDVEDIASPDIPQPQAEG